MSDFAQFVNLASERLGARAIQANDEFFAAKENLLKAAKPVLREGKSTARGAWMDGWETRRRRNPGHDWCVIRLGLRGILRGVAVDTTHFRGNFPERCALEACDLGSGPPFANERKRLKQSRTQWFELLPESPLAGDSHNSFAISHRGSFTHVRLNIYPDGGVARLRVYGLAAPANNLATRAEFDLASVGNGGLVIASSDEFFGSAQNLLMPGDPVDANDGWQTQRRRGSGHDWAVVKLAAPGVIRRVEVDTSHFLGNYPESCSLEICYSGAADITAIPESGWKLLLAQTKLKPGQRHVFREQLREAGAATHARFSIFPDGGVSRLRLFGRAERLEDRLRGVELFNHLAPRQARQALLECCGSKKFAERMLALRPFASGEGALEAAGRVWESLGPKDWLEAFRRREPIRATGKNRKRSPAGRGISAEETAARRKALEETQAILAAAHRAYEATFGRRFIISATDRTPEEILARLRERLANDPEAELRVAAEEQGKITRLRMQKLLHD